MTAGQRRVVFWVVAAFVTAIVLAFLFLTLGTGSGGSGVGPAGAFSPRS